MSLHINVKLGEPIWRATGQRRLVLEWPADTQVGVPDVLARLAASYPAFATAYAGANMSQPYPYRVFVDATPVEPAPLLEHVIDREGEAVPTVATTPDAAASAVSRNRSQAVLNDGQTVFILLPAIGGG